MTVLKWVPKIIYGTGPTTLELTWPQKLWTPSSRPIGGSAVSDSGIPESFVIRRDQLCKVEIRFTEAEWLTMDEFLIWAQNANSFDFWFDKDDEDTAYTCYLDDPRIGDGDVTPSREGYPYVFTIPLVLRTTDGSRFDVRL